MSRKDYELIARALKAAKDYADGSLATYGIYDAMRFVAEELARKNPRFDKTRFLEASGYNFDL